MFCNWFASRFVYTVWSIRYQNTTLENGVKKFKLKKQAGQVNGHASTIPRSLTFLGCKRKHKQTNLIYFNF